MSYVSVDLEKYLLAPGVYALGVYSLKLRMSDLENYLHALGVYTLRVTDRIHNRSPSEGLTALVWMLRHCSLPFGLSNIKHAIRVICWDKMFACPIHLRCLETFVSALRKVRCGKYFAESTLREVRCAKYFAESSLREVLSAKSFPQTTFRKVPSAKYVAQSTLRKVLSAKSFAEST